MHCIKQIWKRKKNYLETDEKENSSEKKLGKIFEMYDGIISNEYEEGTNFRNEME